MKLPPPGSQIHLVGIGGTGMSAIARVLLGQGYRVTGSDRIISEFTNALVTEGAAVVIGHDSANVFGADAVIVTSAAGSDNAEVAAARNAGIPVYKRSEIIGDLMIGKKVIAVAGTAGKTTTTAMIAHLLIAAGRDPSYIIGATLPTTGKNGYAGSGNEFVIEADEYDNMFLGLTPDIAVVTNIVWDHPDFFPTEEGMFETFMRFAERITPKGWLIVCGDDPGTVRLAAEYNAKRKPDLPATTYGTSSDDHARILNLRVENGFPAFEYKFDSDESPLFPVRLSVPGRHNALNAAAAFSAVKAALYLSEVTDDVLLDALATFTGTGRRFEIMGERDGVIVVDDYAHHPLKIRAALEAARSRYPDRAIWAVWQPHTYSRTQALWDDFAGAFGDADHVLVTPIYAAREKPVEGVNAEAMVTAIQQRGHGDAHYAESFEAAVETLSREVQAPAVIMILSAGDAPKIGRGYLGR